ncbi:hypothetical protein NUU61_002653 [Penicillium alfredii]|uniref:NmrA-like domain-containing protein n=1 Tax=Penicillium alfredii TaxID=1506179 RepID=A0A9W9FRW6_9EURO|nr:uncharacterized protein NUU61_002653 [Penicillium alfredii]KAJ5105306.1 hypothetical protein NUU61_002653 [Penicillium alfredii]
MSSPTVFVCGATGTQGGALTYNLLKQGAQVHTITRNLNSPAAQKLKSLGASIAEGDFDNEECLTRSMTNCTTLFLNLMPSFTDSTKEVRQAQMILSVAKKAGIKHVIYSTALAVNDPERLAHWDPNSALGMVVLSKQVIEREVREGGFKYWTILRPGNFMTNHLAPHVQMYQGLAETGQFTTSLTPGSLIPMVDPNVIGQFGAAATLDPVKFHQEEVEIVSELLTVDEVMQGLSRATGREFKATFLSDEEIKEQGQTNPFIWMQLALRDMSKFVDMERIKAWGLELGSFERFLGREKERVEQTYL